MDQIKENLKSALPQVLNVNKKHLNIFGREPVTLSVVYKKLSHCKKSIIAKLPHSLTPSTVCIFTKDACGSDYEKTAEHYKKLAIKENVSGDLTFIAVRELAVCYQTYESKRRLGGTFDMFLADRRIMHRLPTKLGKAFYSKRTFPYPIDLESDLSKEIGTAICSTQLVLRGRGSMESCRIGWMNMPEEELAVNVVALSSQILSKWPGGLANIRAIYVNGSESSVPVYYSHSEYSGPDLSKPTPPRIDTFDEDVAAVLPDLPTPIESGRTSKKFGAGSTSTAGRKQKQKQQKPKKAGGVKRLDRNAPLVKKLKGKPKRRVGKTV